MNHEDNFHSMPSNVFFDKFNAMVEKPIDVDIYKDAIDLFPGTAESVNNLNRERRLAYIIGRQKERGNGLIGRKVRLTDKFKDLYLAPNNIGTIKDAKTYTTRWIISMPDGNEIHAIHTSTDKDPSIDCILIEEEFTIDDMLEAIKYGFEYHRDSMNDDMDVPKGNKLQWILGKYVKPEEWKNWLNKHNLK